MARRLEIAPYRQGQLDGLCGLYALINAIRLATHHHTGEFGHGVWRELLLALLGEAENVVGTATAVVYGIRTKPLYELAKRAARPFGERTWCAGHGQPRSRAEALV